MKRGGKKQPNQRLDPYRVAQAAQRKSANLERRRTLQEERSKALGDPVRSKPTTFLNSLNLTDQSTATTSAGDTYLNYSLTPSATEAQLAHSKWLTEPLAETPRMTSPISPEVHARRVEAHQAEHENAERAIRSITSLVNSSSKDRTRINVQRCIETFGRHVTDTSLPPKPASLGLSRPAVPNIEELADNVGMSEEEAERQRLRAELNAIPKRAGPDTGSSEVQVAILTTKINVLANQLGKQDKKNKRSLTLLVHRRQKLLKYLRRKERGGPRWQNLVDSLGINDAMWKGEIALA